jgi:hypothetical protein
MWQDDGPKDNQEVTKYMVAYGRNERKGKVLILLSEH